MNSESARPVLKVDASLPKILRSTREAAGSLEAAGFDGLWTGETKHDPFLQVLQAAGATTETTVGSAVAIAFGRTPLTVAQTAFDLAEYSHGRFVLGLGSQVKAHVERRFSMPWSHPIARMREYIAALRAIWASWQDGARLSFKGDFYTHTLMTPFFAPEPHAWGPPPVYLAGVGERMTEVAGEVCEGFFFHAFTSPRYVREVTIPALQRGRGGGAADRPRATIAGPVLTCVGRDDDELASAIKATKEQIAFYASTPQYRVVLDFHGWGDLQPELTRLSTAGRWSDMGSAIDNQILTTFAVVGTPKEVGTELRARWAGVSDRITLHTPSGDLWLWAEVLDALRS